MKELIPITYDGEGEPGVDARTLHGFLQVGKRFATWITDRIEKYGFVEGEDYQTFSSLSVPDSGSSKARPQQTIEYALSLEMAKELAMVESNDMGKKARRYFIEVEKQWRSGKLRYEKTRLKSKEYRKAFTDTLKAAGYTQPREYQHTTIGMKQELGFPFVKKDDLDEGQLRLVMAAELIATERVNRLKVHGFRFVHPECVSSSRAVYQHVTKEIE